MEKFERTEKPFKQFVLEVVAVAAGWITAEALWRSGRAIYRCFKKCSSEEIMEE